MPTARTLHQHAHTYLIHTFGRGLDDTRYRVERFQSYASGEIAPYRTNRRNKRGQRKETSRVMSLRSVQRIRPGRNEVIVCTGVEIAGGVQYWGDLATHLFRRRV